MPFRATVVFDAANGRFEERLGFGGETLVDRQLLLGHLAEDLRRGTDDARPDTVTTAAALAARVGRIHADPALAADLLFVNLMIGANVVNAAQGAGVEPRQSRQQLHVAGRRPRSRSPRRASATAGRKPTNETYAAAKLVTASLAAFR